MKPTSTNNEHRDSIEKPDQEWRDGNEVMGQEDQMVALAAQ